MSVKSESSRDWVLEQVITKAGGVVALAKALGGITPAAISQWKAVPPRRVVDVERITGIPRYVLRPDYYPKEGVR